MLPARSQRICSLPGDQDPTAPREQIEQTEQMLLPRRIIRGDILRADTPGKDIPRRSIPGRVILREAILRRTIPGRVFLREAIPKEDTLRKDTLRGNIPGIPTEDPTEGQTLISQISLRLELVQEGQKADGQELITYPLI